MEEEIERTKTLIEFRKRFTKGEQYIAISETGEIEEKTKSYWWEQREVYNHLLPLVESLGNKATEEDIYGDGGLIDRLIPYQKEYNEIKNKKLILLERVIFPYSVVEDGSVDVDDYEEEGLKPGRVLVYRQGAQKPNFDFANPGMFDAFDKSAASVLNTIYSIFKHWKEEHKL